MQMITLGNGLVNGRAILDLVAFQNCDLVEKIRENTSRHQSGNAATDNHSVAAQMSHRSPPLKASIHRRN
jgi:hypothetical protein